MQDLFFIFLSLLEIPSCSLSLSLILSSVVCSFLLLAELPSHTEREERDTHVDTETKSAGRATVFGPVLSLSSSELTLTNDRLRAENDWLSLSALLDITNPSATLMTETTRPDSFPPVILTKKKKKTSAPLSLLTSSPPPFREFRKEKEKNKILWKICFVFPSKT